MLTTTVIMIKAKSTPCIVFVTSFLQYQYITTKIAGRPTVIIPKSVLPKWDRGLALHAGAGVDFLWEQTPKCGDESPAPNLAFVGFFLAAG
jgi:hypothetical protein